MHQPPPRLILASGAALGVIAAAACVSIFLRTPNASLAQPMQPLAPPAPPDEIYLTGVVRDFKEHDVPGGHSDFEQQPDNGFGRYSGNVRLTMDDEGKPVWVGGGHKVASQWRDSSGRQICHTLYDAALGDIEGNWGPASTGGINGVDSFSQWFRDIPGLNLSAPLTLRLVRASDGSYVFDDKLDAEYASKGGFFPIDDQLYGDSPGSPQHNYHFTFELHTQFTYDASAAQVFKFIGDDDVFVFINNRLVIDLGGVHAAHDQFVDLDRLGLVDGETYALDFFFAERHRTQSNFRIQTNLVLTTPAMPTINSGYD
jgi:fibro-slime domain-containing protein